MIGWVALGTIFVLVAVAIPGGVPGGSGVLLGRSVAVGGWVLIVVGLTVEVGANNGVEVYVAVIRDSWVAVAFSGKLFVGAVVPGSSP